MDHEWTEFDVLDPDLSVAICADSCGAKCCNFFFSEFFVEIELLDYYRLWSNDLHRFVTFYSGYTTPQLLHRPNGDCVFLDPKNNECSIYPIRPLGCRKFPYHKKEENTPSWCQLYWRSSPQLRGKQVIRTKEIDNWDPHALPEKVILEYFDKQQRGMSIQDLELDRVLSFETEIDAWYISIFEAIDDQQIFSFIDHLKTTYHDLSWYIVSLLIFDESTRPSYQLQGVWKASQTIPVPVLDQFPSSEDKFHTLLTLAENTEKYMDHLITGAIFNTDRIGTMSLTDPQVS